MGQILTPWKRKSDIFRDGQNSVVATAQAFITTVNNDVKVKN